jgi:hypothetical protein
VITCTQPGHETRKSAQPWPKCQAPDHAITNHHHCQRCNKDTGLIFSAFQDGGVVCGVEQRTCRSYQIGRVVYTDSVSSMERKQKQQPQELEISKDSTAHQKLNNFQHSRQTVTLHTSNIPSRKSIISRLRTLNHPSRTKICVDLTPSYIQTDPSPHVTDGRTQCAKPSKAKMKTVQPVKTQEPSE